MRFRATILGRCGHEFEVGLWRTLFYVLFQPHCPACRKGTGLVGIDPNRPFPWPTETVTMEEARRRWPDASSGKGTSDD